MRDSALQMKPQLGQVRAKARLFGRAAPHQVDTNSGA
jgi:hypothetical protein